jgi:hypothetical protein
MESGHFGRILRDSGSSTPFVQRNRLLSATAQEEAEETGEGENRTRRLGDGIHADAGAGGAGAFVSGDEQG